MLYIISSPIGNLDDFSYRAVKIIPTLDYLLCEDTRQTRILLNRYFPESSKQIKTLPFHENNENEKLSKAVEMLESGLNLGLISNAGTPTISDPGFKLIRECRRRKIGIVPIPGPTALITALSASGLPTDKFYFVGFLPKKNIDRQRLFTFILENKNFIGTIVIYESPFRLLDCLSDLKHQFGDIKIVIAREITKLYETFYLDKISVLVGDLKKIKIKGEIVILFNLKENE